MTRPRPLTLVAAAVGFALALTGCSNPDNEQAAAPETAATRTVEDTYLGDVPDVPLAPQRIVALWRTGGLLADIGVDVVGQLEDEFSETELDPDVYAQYADVPVIGTYDGIDVEAVIDLDPDLIVGMDNGSLGFDYEELQAVAPTVILDIAEPTDVWANYPEIAELVGEATDFDSRLADLDAQLADIAAEHGDVVGGLEVTSIGAFDGTIWVETSKSLSYARLAAAGFGYNPTYTDDPERYVTELSLENIADLADQDIIFYDASLDGTPLPGTADVMATDSFQRLPAAQAGHVFPLTSGTIYTFTAAELQVRDMLAAVAAYQP